LENTKEHAAESGTESGLDHREGEEKGSARRVGDFRVKPVDDAGISPLIATLFTPRMIRFVQSQTSHRQHSHTLLLLLGLLAMSTSRIIRAQILRFLTRPPPSSSTDELASLPDSQLESLPLARMSNSGLRGTTAAQDTVSPPPPPSACSPTYHAHLPTMLIHHHPVGRSIPQRFKDKESKAIKGTKFPIEFEKKVKNHHLVCPVRNLTSPSSGR
jgi:hypothetical protein